MGFRRTEPPETLRLIFFFFTSCDEAHLNGERFQKPLWNMIFFLNVDIKMK